MIKHCVGLHEDSDIVNIGCLGRVSIVCTSCVYEFSDHWIGYFGYFITL